MLTCIIIFTNLAIYILHPPVLSIEFDRRNDPSGLNFRPDTVSVCPDIVYKISFFLKSQTYMKTN